MQFHLSSPYPAPRPGRPALVAGLFMGLFVACFLLYFRPFGMRYGAYADAPIWIALFGLITFVCFLVVEVFLPMLMPLWFQDRNWRVWHRILYYLFLLWLIATANGLYINWLYGLTFSWANYALIMTQTLALGVLPVTMIVLFRFNQKSVFYLKQAAEFRQKSSTVAVPTPALTEADPEEALPVFLAAEAFGNYVKVYFATDEGYRQEVQRVTLVSLVAEREEAGVIRCHRSFAVQPERVHEVSGNAQGLRLLVGNGDLEVPVSRTYLPAVKAALA